MQHIASMLKGYICVGNIALKTNEPTSIEAPDRDDRDAKVMNRIVQERAVLPPRCRVVSPSEFVRATGITVVTPTDTIKPHRVTAKPNAKQVTSLIR